MQFPLHQNKSLCVFAAARQRVIEELVETERTYCSALWCVLQDFAIPVSESGLATEVELRYLTHLHPLEQSQLIYSPCRVIFPSSLDAIYEHHCTLLRQLEDRLHASASNTGAIIGDIMAKAFESREVRFSIASFSINIYLALLSHRAVCCRITRAM